ncbi:TIGR02206 family membrane protein [Bacillus daqingensis]|uniref:TIGR02206 family membrane protein n=1 Tax=Bacillus daqingensis TaxID=872396 RepID=A0ABV9NPK9_9BACI
MFFGGDASEAPFTMFDWQHISALALLIGAILFVRLNQNRSPNRRLEWTAALLLAGMEVWYQLWLLMTERWEVHHALPLELSNIMVICTIILLLTRNQFVFEVVFMAGIASALMAFLTPVLSFGLPHARFFHFFLTHGAVIITGFYFLWVHRYSLSFRSVWLTLLLLNVLLPFIWIINRATGGNYWFIMDRPDGTSLLDLFGGQPWHIIGMEATAAAAFLLLWMLFGDWRKKP